MDDRDQGQGELTRTFGFSDRDGAAAQNYEILAIAAEILQRTPVEPPRRDLGQSLAALGHVFDNLERLQLRCSMLEAEKMQARFDSEAVVQDAYGRIKQLEEVVTGLMRLIAKYDALLKDSALRTRDAESRAAVAEFRVREAERGTADAIEWLHRYMRDELRLPG